MMYYFYNEVQMINYASEGVSCDKINKTFIDNSP